MQLETLKIFCDLVETKSLSRAAERNFVTQSAVSQQVRGLGEKFKRRLLERIGGGRGGGRGEGGPQVRGLGEKFRRRRLERMRGGREVGLTEDGEVFYQESRQIVAAYTQLEER